MAPKLSMWNLLAVSDFACETVCLHVIDSHSQLLPPSVVDKKKLVLSSTSEEEPPIIFDECLWCTSAGVAPWFVSQTPFDTTTEGFLTVNDTFESTSHAGVFAAGDCSHMVNHARAKAGVFAVRAGPPLYENVTRFLLEKPLKSHRPQREFLGLVSTGDPYAIASRGRWFSMEGRFIWKWKDHIDRTWMAKYKELPDIEEMMANMPPPKRKKQSDVPTHVGKKGRSVEEAFSADPMRCGGCGAKVGATTVSRVLKAVHDRQIRRAKALSLPIPPPIDHDVLSVIYIRSVCLWKGCCCSRSERRSCHGGGSEDFTCIGSRSFCS